MDENSYRVYGYRWVVLLVFALLNGVIQLNWITFAPITVDCIVLYETSAFWIVMLSMSFMLVYIIVSVPASFIIDRYGIRIGVGIGAVLVSVFGYLRGAYAHDFTIVMVSQIFLAVAQPFIMNSITKVGAEWFPLNERATVAGIVALSQFVGIILAMALTKPLAQSFMSEGSTGPLDIAAVSGMLYIYGYISIAAGVLFILFARDCPPTPPSSAEDAERFSVKKGFSHLFAQPDMIRLLFLFFIGLGMFNAISTFIDIILASKGFVAGGNEAGNVGAIMMVAGVLGAIIIPTISDRIMKRKIFLVLCMTGMLPGLAGLTFFSGYVALLVSSGIFGFFFMAAYPIGFQYAAEVSHPAPESTSQGLIVLSGQVSGAIFITVMALLGNISVEILADARKAADSITMTPFMAGFVALAVVNIVISLFMKESSLVTDKRDG